MLGPDSLHYRVFTCVWALACVMRFTLLEAQHGWWWAATIVLVCGAIGLVRYGGRAWWLLCVIGIAWPYFFLRDWMTQSAVMLLIGLVGVATTHRDDKHPPVLIAAHWLVACTYFIAAFHKLNTGFLDPALSCATYGWDKLGGFFHLQALFGGVLSRARFAMPWAVLITELTIGVLLCGRSRRTRLVGIALGGLFHIPLTLVLAPAFVFVMAIGYIAALAPSDIRVLFQVLSRPTIRRVMGASLGITFLVSCLIGRTFSDGVLGVKVLLVGALAVWCLKRLSVTAPTVTAPARPQRRWAALVVALFLANAMTPYVGTQTQHTGAMLSNLRIDAGCWNHLLIPEAARRTDPYLRIDAAQVGPDERRLTDREEVLTSTLWAPSALPLIRQNWCRPFTRPIAIEGTFLGQPFAVTDVCAGEEALPVGVGYFGGQERFTGFLKLQKNLMRECPTACIH